MSQQTAYDVKLEHILRISADIFAEKGYHQASIRDIARSTRVSLSGLYYYFNSKEELLFIIQDHAFGTLLTKLDSLLHGETDPLRRLRLLIENHLRFFASNMAEMKVLSHEADSLTGDFARRVNAKKKRLRDIVRGILRDIESDDTLDERVAAFSLFGMMNWLYNWYRPDGDLSVEELAEQMSGLFLRGYLREGLSVPAAAREGAPGESQPKLWSSGDGAAT